MKRKEVAQGLCLVRVKTWSVRLRSAGSMFVAFSMSLKVKMPAAVLEKSSSTTMESVGTLIWYCL
jgi:hypothetical protein